MLVSEIMTSKPAVVCSREPIRCAAELMAQFDIGALPVVDNYDERRLIGIITDRDIVVRHVAPGGSRDCTVDDHMSSNDVKAVRPDTDVRDALRVMGASQIRRMPVVNESGAVVGMIAQADIARRLGRVFPIAVEELLEEISTPRILQKRS